MNTALKALLLVVALATLASGQNQFTVVTDRLYYLPGDTIRIRLTYWNNSDSAAVLEFPDACLNNFCIDNGPSWRDSIDCDAVLTSVTIPPQGSYDWNHYALATLDTGDHSLTGWIGSSDSNGTIYGIGRAQFRVEWENAHNELTIWTDRSTYNDYDSMFIRVSYWNNRATTDGLFTLAYPCFEYCVVDSFWKYRSPGGCLPTPGVLPISPRSANHWDIRTLAKFGIGNHTIVSVQDTGGATIRTERDIIIIGEERPDGVSVNVKPSFAPWERIQSAVFLANNSDTLLSLGFTNLCRANTVIDSAIFSSQSPEAGCKPFNHIVKIHSHSAEQWLDTV